ncbi:MAG: mannose-6-phosphate isomerase [Hyphomicrobiales bacterium]|nr:mannose-6-phosphate isomerase [Hyphomicrobiales bacterium]
MTIELAAKRIVRKLRGRVETKPWGGLSLDDSPIGELWFQRADRNSPDPDLLLKLLVTEEPLSIQLRPNDSFGETFGMAHGKTEAWYVVSAAPDAKIAVGLKQPLTSSELRAAIEDGSIVDQVQWHPVEKDRALFVPAGTVHAIGPGIVVAQIQQRTDATFRLIEHGRDLRVVTDARTVPPVPLPGLAEAVPLTHARTLLVAGPHFVLEHFDLPAGSIWDCDAGRETWLLALEGDAGVGPFRVGAGAAVFLEDHRTTINVGAGGFKGLIAYLGTRPHASLLRERGAQLSIHPQFSDPSDDADQRTAEQRRAPRRRVLKEGTIVINGGRSVIPCTVRNISGTGALIRVETVIGVPAVFSLVVGIFGPWRCSVVRRQSNELGLRFDTPLRELPFGEPV